MANGEEERLGCTPEKAFREVVVFELSPEDTPRKDWPGDRADNSNRQELELKNFTHPDHTHRVLADRLFPEPVNHSQFANIKFPVRRISIPCSRQKHSLPSYLGNISTSF